MLLTISHLSEGRGENTERLDASNKTKTKKVLKLNKEMTFMIAIPLTPFILLSSGLRTQQHLDL
jgi:hypothetical protein